MGTEVRNNKERRRYELLKDNTVIGIADYDVDGETIVFPHTEIVPSLRGQGYGEQLVGAALDDVREHGAKVRALCWFVRDFIATNPSYEDLTAA